jgi:DNA helicase-2/ATP-dependent DNA helicase PcrA
MRQVALPLQVTWTTLPGVKNRLKYRFTFYSNLCAYFITLHTALYTASHAPIMTLSVLQQQMASLNPAQKQAVESPLGHMLISAGAGTGKTRVLTLRYAHLALHHDINPATIMAVTFTNKAANEMKRRLRDLFPVHNLWIGTFHSLGLRLLRHHAALIGRSNDFSILDTHDQNTLVQKLLKKTSSKKVYTPRMVLSAISQWKHRLLSPQEVTKALVPFYLELYHAYEDHLRVMNGLDFDDLLLCSLKILAANPEIAESYAFQHILVDEYQDINEMQYLWLRACSNVRTHLFCVGDDDQSIYGWRGASVDKILKFTTDFPSAGIVCLEDNYRSTPHILSAASHLIAHNPERHGKVLRTQVVSGEKVRIQGLWDSGEEAAFVAETIMTSARAGIGLNTMALLVRTSAQTREFEERFSLQNIPYYLVGNTRFYDRMEIRDVVAYLRTIHSQTDNLAFERIINTPKRGIGDATLQTLYTMVPDHQGSLELAARALCTTLKEGVLRRALDGFLSAITLWRQALTSEITLGALTDRIIVESGYGLMWAEQGIQGQARMDNIKELIKSIDNFPTLGEFLEHVSLLTEVNEGAHNEGIALMTLHAAKGLEFDHVFLPGWEEGVFPHIRCIEESGKKGVEEERRLAYVGLTRAKKSSTISFCWNRKGHQGFSPSSPSRFIQELPEADVTMSLKLNYAAKDVSLNEQKRVMHSVFGPGVVQNQMGHMTSVLFEKHGLKKVIDRFLTFLS